MNPVIFVPRKRIKMNPFVREIDATKLIDTLRCSSCDRHASKSVNHFGHAGAYSSFPVVSFLINQVIDTY